MAKIRNVSGEALFVPGVGYSGAVVQPDQVVEVPDDRLDSYAYQEHLWSVEADKNKKSTEPTKES
jgi:hypothetical protein